MPEPVSFTPFTKPDDARSLIDPITSVRLLSEVLRDHPEMDANQRRHFIALILNSTDRLISIVNRMPEEPTYPANAVAF